MRFNKGTVFFNPMLLDKEEITNQPLLNKYIFDTIMDDVTKSIRNSMPQHFVMMGPHGSGKTTLLLRIFFELGNYSKSHKNVLPIIFNEEEYSVVSLDLLFNRAQQQMELNDAPMPVRSVNDIIARPSDEDPLLVLLIDNFGDLLTRLSYNEQQRFREILIQCSKLQIVGTTSQHLQHFQEYKTPFFDYFNTLSIQELSREQLPEFINYLCNSSKAAEEHILEIDNDRAKVFINLTGGNLRLTTLGFHILASKTYSETLRELEQLLDIVTAPFKATMDSLTSEAAVIVDLLAKSWSGLPLAECFDHTGNDINIWEHAVQELRLKMIVNKTVDLDNQAVLQIKDRLFNIWYLMRYGGEKGRERTAWFVRFLEDWYLPKELKSIYTGINDDFISEESIDGSFAWLDELALPSDSSVAYELTAIADIVKSNLTQPDTESTHSSITTTVLTEAVFAFIKGDEETAIKIAIDHAHDNQLMALLAGALIERSGTGDIEEASKFYKISHTNGSNIAAYECGLMWRYRGRNIKNARHWFVLAVERNVSAAALQLGDISMRVDNDYAIAEEYYFKAVTAGNFNAFKRLGDLYAYGYREDTVAHKYYLVGAEAGDPASINGLGNIAVYFEADSQKAEEFFQRAIEGGNINAINNIACLYAFDYGKLDTAEEYFLKAMEAGHERALHNLMSMYKNSGGGSSKNALFFAERFLKGREDSESKILYALLICRNKQVDRAVGLFKKVVVKLITVEGELRLARIFLIQLLALEKYSHLLSISLYADGIVERAFSPIFDASEFLQSKHNKVSAQSSTSRLQLDPVVDEIIQEVAKIQEQLTINSKA